MRIDQIANVHIVTNTGAIWRVVIRAKDRQRGAFAVNRIEHQRDQMRLGLVKLTHLGLGISASNVKVTKYNAFHPVRGFEILKNILNRAL